MPRVRGILEDAAIDAEIAEALVPLARLLTTRLRAARAIADETPAFYSTRGPLPPGMSRRAFRELAHEMPGHERLGGASGKGVEHRVPAAGFDTWRTAKDAKRRRAPAVVATSDQQGDDVERWMRENNLRTTRRSA